MSSTILRDALSLHAMWKKGRLGGEVMPEDVHPAVGRQSEELGRYFTLGMSLNYQRNSYALWRSCTAAFEDPTAQWVFSPQAVLAAPLDALAEVLVRHKVALQPNRHPAIWRENAAGLMRHADGRIQDLFQSHDFDLGRIRAFVTENKRDFPYLAGPKIVNYWLYVMSGYMAWPLHNREALNVAPDRHVVAASQRLGLIRAEETETLRLPLLAAQRWEQLLAGSRLSPIDIHTPLWLWSRLEFPAIEHEG